MKFKLSIITLNIFVLFSGTSSSLFAKPKILVLTSAANSLVLDSNSNYPTGVFGNELYEPVKELELKGFQIVFVTPGGKKPTIDPESLKDKYWKSEFEKNEAIQYLDSHPSFLKPLTLEEVAKNKEHYMGILVPGGQGLMSDLLYDPLVPKILSDFQKDKRPIGLICHAPILLTTLPNGSTEVDFLFRGYKVNSVSKMEEWFIETFVMKGTPKVRKISQLLRERGMVYESSLLPGMGYAVRDRNLVTSQNPFSGQEFTNHFLKVILEEREKRGL
jgi:putative intracellular protease/amidase